MPVFGAALVSNHHSPKSTFLSFDSFLLTRTNRLREILAISFPSEKKDALWLNQEMKHNLRESGNFKKGGELSCLAMSCFSSPNSNVLFVSMILKSGFCDWDSDRKALDSTSMPHFCNSLNKLTTYKRVHSEIAKNDKHKQYALLSNVRDKVFIATFIMWLHFFIDCFQQHHLPFSCCYFSILRILKKKTFCKVTFEMQEWNQNARSNSNVSVIITHILEVKINRFILFPHKISS